MQKSLNKFLLKFWIPCRVYLLGIRVPAQVLTTKIQDENKGTKIDNRQRI